jgi:hypothetical protein
MHFRRARGETVYSAAIELRQRSCNLLLYLPSLQHLHCEACP